MPGLFQLLKVVFDSTDHSVVEKVVVETELAGLCNVFSPNSSSPDCSKIDFDSLKKSFVIPIGLAGSNRAIYDFLQNHLNLCPTIDYEKMVDPKFCSTGLYALCQTRRRFLCFTGVQETTRQSLKSQA